MTKIVKKQGKLTHCPRCGRLAKWIGECAITDKKTGQQMRLLFCRRCPWEKILKEKEVKAPTKALSK